ncbi:MSMEG_4193 family putative phosphomutase [Ornithinimicrobium pratense]|uniref:MSMEG_4193 family putative phosphomutase n=1 Tax=Ornithinimicrobium pratense TaxID=2593973 RepID=A0A5J6V6C4_9MICO|nr:MSMEG_4193 family putative phosphomutase [Ornithinimicrobium pratense]QFG68676.1 MSMEG_4193 family putative phosphomutase [Ornithinimicrobium pratense]
MAICILLRHGRTRANADGTLAGWTPGVGLDETGLQQARRVGERLAETALAAVVSSPLQRCAETAAAVVAAQPADRVVARHTDDRLGEARYGAWTGRPLAELATEPLWRQVQDAPSQVTFPGHEEFEHEAMADMQARAVAAVQEWDARLEAEHGPGAVWGAVSHGDVIKAILAHTLATSLDDFQRIVVDPASLSIVHRTSARPFVLRMNDTGSDPVDLAGLVARIAAGASGDAEVGGGSGGLGRGEQSAGDVG